MRKLLEDKRFGLALAVLAFLALILLAGAIRTMDFNPAEPIGSSDTNTGSVDLTPIATLLTDAAEAPFWGQVTFWGGLFIIILLISSLLSPELRKKLILTFIRAALIVTVLLYIVKNNPNVLAALFLKFPTFADTGDAATGQEIAPPVFEPPQVPSYLSFFITFGIILISIILAWVIYRWWERQKEILASRPPLKEIADIARLSLKNIEEGLNSDDAIIQCYERMSNVVNSKRGLQRERAMTPAEFASRLERAGLPREPVDRLTRLFESTRYGAHKSGTPEITEAVTCLTSILKYCGEAQ